MIKTMGFDVFSSHLDCIKLDSQTKICNTISPNSYGMSVKDAAFRKALKRSDYLVLDGVYFALASIFLNHRNIIKNQGPDIFDFFIKKMNKEKGRVFFLGASQETLDKIKQKLNEEYPNITAGFYSPPFKDSFTEKENNDMFDCVNKFKPDILFVGMTCPKQEKWAFENKENIQASLVCCIGAVFDWYAGNQKEISPIWWKLRLAWLIRTIHRPEILKRYPNIGIFFWHLFLAILGSKKYKYGKF